MLASPGEVPGFNFDNLIVGPTNAASGSFGRGIYKVVVSTYNADTIIIPPPKGAEFMDTVLVETDAADRNLEIQVRLPPAREE